MTRYPGYAEDLEVGRPSYTMPTSRADFEEVFPLLVQDLTNHATQYGLPETALVWFRNVCLLLCSSRASTSNPHSKNSILTSIALLEPQSQHCRWQIEPWHLRR